MRKFLQFIYILLEPVISFILKVAAILLAFIWVFTGFGLLPVLCPTAFPTPLWVRWVIGILDAVIVIVVAYGYIKEAYEKVYKN